MADPTLELTSSQQGTPEPPEASAAGSTFLLLMTILAMLATGCPNTELERQVGRLTVKVDHLEEVLDRMERQMTGSATPVPAAGLPLVQPDRIAWPTPFVLPRDSAR